MNVGELVGILRLDDQMEEGTRRALNEAERRFGQGGDAAGERFVRGADGKVRDTLTGRFASAGQLAGTEFGEEASDGMGSEMGSKGPGAIGGVLATIGTAVAGAALAAGAVIGGSLMKGLSDAMEQEAGGDILAARLGLEGEAAAAAGRAAGEVYANNFGESMEEARAAVDAVWSTLGDSIGNADDALPRAAERALTLVQILEVDVAEAANTAGVMIQTGLARDAYHAFDLMTYAAQGMPAQMRGELIPIVEEYSGFLADMGITGEEAFDLLARASQKGGAFGMDKLPDALKELGIRATDMSATSIAAYEAAGLNAEEMSARFVAGGESARGALDDLIDGLLGIEDPVARSNAAIGLFGTPLEDLSVADIPEFLGMLDEMGTGVEDVAGRTEQAAATIGDNATSKIETFKRKGLMALSTFMADNVLPGLNNFLDRAGPIFDELAAEWESGGFEGVANKLGEKAREVAPTVVEWLVNGFREYYPKAARAWFGFLGGLAADAGRAIIRNAPGWLESLGELIGRASNWVAEVGAPMLGERLKELGPRLWQWIQDAGPEVVKKLGGLLVAFSLWFAETGRPWMFEKGRELGEALLEWWWTDAYPSITAAVASFLVAAAEWITTTGIPRLKEKGREWWGKLVEAAREKGPELLAWLAETAVSVGAWIADTGIPTLRSKAAEWFGKLVEAASEKGLALLGWAMGIPGRILSAIGDLGTTLFGAGVDLIQGLIDGVVSKVGDLWSQLGGITDEIAERKGPPSRDRVLLRPAGRLVLGGFIDGIDDQVPALHRQLRNVTSLVAAYDADLTGRLPGRAANPTAPSGWTPSAAQIDYRRLGAAVADAIERRPYRIELDGEAVGRSPRVYRGIARQAAQDRRGRAA